MTALREHVETARLEDLRWLADTGDAPATSGAGYSRASRNSET